MIQQKHDTNPFQEKSFPLVLLLDNISGPANLGSLFRLADAFNIEKIVSCGPSVDLTSNRLKRTARATIDSMAFEQQEDPVSACREYAEKGYSILALEIARGSQPVESMSYSEFHKIVLVLGNENSGISEEVLGIADLKLHINMFGKNSSMNVAQACGIAFFEITKTLQQL